VDQRVVNLTADLAVGKRINFVTYTDTDMTFHFTDSSTQTIPLPVITLKYVGPWMPSTPYVRGDLFTESGTSGFYQVLENHTSAATFNPNATDGTTANNPLYQLWMPLFDTLDSLKDVTISAPANGQVLTYAGTVGWINQAPVSAALNLDGLTDVVITSPSNGQALVFSGTTWLNGAVSINNLGSVAIASPVAGQLFAFNGSAWANQSFADFPILNSGSVSGSLAINLQTNEFIRLQLGGNLTISSFTWPTSSSGRMVHRILEIKGSASFTVTWPSSIKWAGGTVPVLTPGGTDVYVIYSYDGGATVFGNVVGQAYA
jgi:hypothetical protein